MPMTAQAIGEHMEKIESTLEQLSKKLGDKSAAAPEKVAKPAAFAELQPASTGGEPAPLQGLLDVKVLVTAELGRRQMLIGDVLKLGAGSVVQLDRSVSEPVDLVVQGVCLARGEVVVVEDRFAIRIKEIVNPRK